MSAIGKGSLSLRKKDVTTQKSIGVGFTKVVFAHKATGGEASINLNSLSTPSELSSQGFVQPSPSTLTGLNIYFYRRNLTLISSLRGVLMDFLSYTVASNTLIKLSGFTLEPNEIIVGVVDPMPRNELLVVDGEAIAATGELAVGVTDFAVGTPFETNKYPTQQIGAVKVYRNGLLQARCEGNSLVNDGNYIEVPVSGGLGSLIRFKTAPVNQADNIIVTSNGAYFERPSASMMANIEALGGQLDKVVQILSDVSGQPETYFQANPNQVDLRQFGDAVITLQQTVASYVGANLLAATQYDLTVTGAGWATTRAKGVPYRTLDGSWRFRFNIRGTATSASSITLTISGVTFGDLQACSAAGNNGGATGWYAVANAGASTITLTANAAATQWVVSGDVELTNKPSFVP